MGILKYILIFMLILMNSQIINCQTRISLDVKHGKIKDKEFIPVVLIVTNNTDSVISLLYNEIIGIVPSDSFEKGFGWEGKIYNDNNPINLNEPVEVNIDLRDKYLYFTRYGVFKFNLKDYCYYCNQFSIQPGKNIRFKALISINNEIYKKLQPGIEYTVKINYNTDALLKRYPKLNNKNFTKGLNLEGKFNFRISVK